MGSDISKPLDQNLETDLATGLGGTRSSLPFEDTALMHWTTESGIVEGGAGKVASWTDRIAGVTVSQSTEANQPTYAESDYFRGATAITTAVGSSQLLDVDNSADVPDLDSGDWTVVWVGRVLNDVTSDPTVFQLTAAPSSSTESIRIIWDVSDNRVTGSLTEASGTTNSQGSVDSIPRGGMQVIGLGHGESAGEAYPYSREDGRETRTNTRTPQNLDTVTVGSSVFGSGQGSAVVEIAVYDHALTADEWSTVLAHFDAKYRPAEAPLRHGAEHWWDPTSGITLRDDTYVTAWVDRIGGVSVSQGTEANQPELLTSIRTGHLALKGNGSQYLFADGQGPELLFYGVHTAYAEFVSDSLGVGENLFGAGDTTVSAAYARMQTNASNRIGYDLRDGVTSDVETLPLGSSRELAAHWAYGFTDGTNMGCAGLGAAEETQSYDSSPSTYDRFALLSRPSGATFSSPWSGEIGHVFLFARALTAAEHADVQAWLEEQWASVEVPTRLGALWDFDPTSGITLNGSDVSAHVDKISAFTLSQGTEANQPAFVSASGSTPAYLDYDGSATFMTAADADLLSTLNSDTFESWVALRPEVATSGTPAGAFDSSSSTIRHRHALTGGPSHNAQSHDGTTIGTASGTGLAASADGWGRATFAGLSSRSTQTSAGSEGSNATTLTAITTIDNWCQGRRNRSAPDQYYDGRLYRDIGFARELGTDDRADMEAFLEALLGI